MKWKKPKTKYFMQKIIHRKAVIRISPAGAGVKRLIFMPEHEQGMKLQRDQ